LSISAGEAEAVHQHADRADDAGLVYINAVGGRRNVVAARGADVLDHRVERDVGIQAAQAADFVVDDALCTGLPPGLLMRRMTLPGCSILEGRLQRSHRRFSALASPVDLMTPFSSTSAVCLRCRRPD
jgi:hypothetical protein